MRHLLIKHFAMIKAPLILYCTDLSNIEPSAFTTPSFPWLPSMWWVITPIPVRFILNHTAARAASWRVQLVGKGEVMRFKPRYAFQEVMRRDVVDLAPLFWTSRIWKCILGWLQVEVAFLRKALVGRNAAKVWRFDSVEIGGLHVERSVLLSWRFSCSALLLATSSWRWVGVCLFFLEGGGG